LWDIQASKLVPQPPTAAKRELWGASPLPTRTHVYVTIESIGSPQAGTQLSQLPSAPPGLTGAALIFELLRQFIKRQAAFRGHDMVDPLAGHEKTSKAYVAGQGPADQAELPAKLTDDPQWLFVEDGFTLAREHELESLFAIGNGYVGSRGSLSEGSALSSPATFVAGVFESVDTGQALAPMVDWTRKAYSGGSGGIRTRAVESHDYERCALPRWQTTTCSCRA
jgi:hypothetical protein